MAQLPDETIVAVLNLQQQLLTIMNQATATEFLILEQYGETEATLIDLDQLQNINERADTYYSRFYTLLRQIVKAQPKANTAMLDLLARSIEEAELTVDALNASIQEIKQDWNIL
ncbi:MAG: hypothetical protein KME17_26015 [Cyanosarcina radialis HA8281-LM2]|nr:hypothetical protein [Cyanosarcina radialis HA8281-LM2]